MQRLNRLILYAILLAGSATFLFPLVWMVSTALKPIDQTMAMPPNWIPYAWTTPLNGTPTTVTRGAELTAPAILVRDSVTGDRQVLPPSDLAADRWLTAPGGPRPISRLADIPASPAAPWTIVTPESGGEWQVVAASSLSRHLSPRWGNFGKAIHAMQHFPRYLANTLLLCLLTVIGTVTSSALAAYGFARIPWRGRRYVFALAMATMMIPFPVIMVPLYSLFRWLGWIGSLRPLWVGSFCAGAFNVFLLRQFFMTIPQDLSDAARVDGCNEFTIFLRIILPLARPALMVVGLFQFMATWNDFLGPLIYLTDQNDFTLALGLQAFQSQHGGTEWHYLMAAGTLVTLPVVILFFFTQRTFIEGISMTGIKG